MGKHTEHISVGIVLKAMGVQSDMEIVQMVGTERQFTEALMSSLQEPQSYGKHIEKVLQNHDKIMAARSAAS